VKRTANFFRFVRAVTAVVIDVTIPVRRNTTPIVALEIAGGTGAGSDETRTTVDKLIFH